MELRANERRPVNGGRLETVEMFLPSTLSALEVRDHAYSTIRVIASEANEFVDQIRIGTGIRQADSW